MSIPKLIQQYTPEEIADALVVPVKLTIKQQKEADLELIRARKQSQSELTEEQKRYAALLQLRFQLEDYLKEDRYDPTLTFGHYLELYLKLSHKKNKEFASEIQIHETLLSHLIKNRREPNYSIMIRLELHSNKIIPAIDWYRLAEKQREHQIKTDKSLRIRESKYVTGSLHLT